jgi:hypothetical protein
MFEGFGRFSFLLFIPVRLVPSFIFVRVVRSRGTKANDGTKMNDGTKTNERNDTNPNVSNSPNCSNDYSPVSPTRKRTNREIWMFSPVFALACATSCAIVTALSRTDG